MPPTRRQHDARQALRRQKHVVFRALTFLAAAAVANYSSAAEIRDWRQTPYSVHIVVGVDTAFRPQPALETKISRHIVDRVKATISPLWTLKLKSADDAAGKRYCLDPREIPWEDLTAQQKAFDKLLWLGVEATPHGYSLVCREFDSYVRRWGPVHRRDAAQSLFLPEACFNLLNRVFRPLAVVQTIAENDEQIQLVFKGSGLPRRSDEPLFVAPGDLYQPLMRRTDRSGALIQDGIQPVPWTLLTAAQPRQDVWLADVHTGLRRAFAGRTRALVEQIAIGVRNPPGPTRVRFYARTDRTEGLAGYEVFSSRDDGANELVGLTDHDGAIVIPPGTGSLTTLLLRSDGRILAKIPVPGGAGETLETPIADNVARLQAQAEARVVREQLIDVVARRAIMMGRVRAYLKNGRVEDARKLMAELDALPSPSVFSRSIDSAARRVPASADPRVQQAIDGMFSTTRELLSKFLSTRPITELQSEVNAAASSGS